MIEALFVTKKFNTYADTFMLLGLAQILDDALNRTKQNREMQLIDEGTNYRIQFAKAIDPEPISQLDYTNPFPPVKGQKTNWSQMPAETPFFDAVNEVKKRKLYQQYRYQTGGKIEWSEEAPKPPDPRTQNAAILVSMRHDRNHNSLWSQSWNIKEFYGILVNSLCQVFSTNKPESQLVAELFGQQTNSKLPEVAAAVKIYLPTAVQGVNRIKADSNKTDAQKIDWLTLWLIANGLFAFAISERVKIAERVYDWRVVALEPKDISFEKYREVLQTLRQFNPPGGGHGVARFDAELVLKLCQQMLENHHAKAEGKPENQFDFWGKPVNEFVGSFRGTHFGSKGQVYGVKELFTLGLPGWIIPDNFSQLLDYLDVLKEHLSVIVSLSAEEGHSELLAAYRDFITGSNLQSFFRFQVSYADYAVKCLADAKSRQPRLFSLQGLKLMTQNFKHRKDDQEWSLTEITKDPGFLNIAKAINSATVYAGTVIDKDKKPKDTGWERIYGLAQRLSSQSGSKKDFIIEISAFLASYENENLRIDDELRKQKKPRRIWTTKDDLDRLIHLVDKFGSSLVANLLIAYGYARGWGKAKDDEQLDGTQVLNENLESSNKEDFEESDEGESENDDE